MVISGYSTDKDPFAENGRLMRFMVWWSDYDKGRTDRWFPRDFMMYERERNALMWYYAIPDDAEIDCEFEVIDFSGGLYVSGVAIDGNTTDESEVYDAIKKWVKDSDVFELDEKPGHYDLFRVITPEKVQNVIGHNQLEIYVPIKLKG